MKSKLINYFIQSFSLIFFLPFLVMKFCPPELGLFIMIIFLMIIIPIYFIVSGLKFDSKIMWFIPLINTVFFLLTAKTILNSSAYTYLYSYIPLSYLAILIKFIIKNSRKIK